MKYQSQDAEATSEELIKYYNILTGKPPETPQEFSLKESNPQPGLGRTIRYGETIWSNNHDLDGSYERAILFKRATYDDLNKREGDWSNLEANGPITSLSFTVRGAYLPDITTRISAEGKSLDRLRDETTAVFDIMKDLKMHMENREFKKKAKPSKIIRDFFYEEYGVKSRAERLEYEDEYVSPLDRTIQIKAVLQEGSQADLKRYKTATDYFRVLARIPKDVQFPSEQTASTLRIGGLSPVGRVEALLGKHNDGLGLVYNQICLS